MKNIFILVMATFAIEGFAGNEQRDCRVDSVPVDLYGNHIASCAATTQHGESFLLSKFVPEQYSNSKTLGTSGASCSVTLNFFRTIYQDQQVCDYTPKAIIETLYINPPTLPHMATTIHRSVSTDSDGDIVKTEWIINGVAHSSEVWGYQSISPPSSLKLRVTDNDGHTDTLNIL